MYKEVWSYLLGFDLLVFHLLGFNLLYNKVLIYIQGYNINQGKKKKRVVIYTKCYYMFFKRLLQKETTKQIN